MAGFRPSLTSVIYLTVLATLAWWTAPKWWPHVENRARQAWQQSGGAGAAASVRSGAARLGAAVSGAAGESAPADLDAAQPAPAPTLRKCLRGGSVVYTDQNCPTGSREEGVDGAVTTVH